MYLCYSDGNMSEELTQVGVILYCDVWSSCLLQIYSRLQEIDADSAPSRYLFSPVY